MKNGQIIVRVALEKGPTDTVEEFDWTDLTDRVRAYRDQRGRTDVLQEFGAGTCDITLDNGDRMLDPSNPDGLLFNDSDEPIGLPLCPVKVTVWWNGAEYPKFRGFLGPEAWPGGTAPKGESGTVTLSAVDAVGCSPEMPGDIWGIMTASLRPDNWLRMDEFEFPILDDASPVPDNVTGGAAVIEGTTGISRPYVYPGSTEESGVLYPALLLSGDHQIRHSAAEVMPDGDEDELSFQMWWAPRQTGSMGDPILASGDIAWVAQMVHPLTGEKRWSIYVDGDDGLAYVTTFDSAGDPIESDAVEPLVSPRWDDGSAHQITAVYDVNVLTVWFGGVSVVLNAENGLGASDLIVGGAPVDVAVDEVAVWRRALSYATEIAPEQLVGAGSLWGGDTWADRLGRWIEATGRDVLSDDTEQWHVPGDDTLGLWGLLHRSQRGPAAGGGFSDLFTITLPGTLADAFQQTVEWGGGARWATKDGYLRARTIHALTDPAFTEDYQTPCTFTDQDEIGDVAGVYRHAGVEVTGLRIDRIVNEARIDYLYSADEPPDDNTATPLAARKTDTASRDRYGLRSRTFQSEWAGWPLNEQLAQIMIDRFSEPHQEIESIHLDPLGEDDLASWLIVSCELEKACSVQYTPAGADPVLIEDLNIQHIEWDWTPERWSVDLVAAKS